MTVDNHKTWNCEITTLMSDTMKNEGHSYSQETEKFIAIFNFILATTVILMNSFILSIVFCNWKTIQRQSNNKASILLTINLCTADFIMGIFDIYYSLPVYLSDINKYLSQHKIACIMSFTLVTTTNMASGYTLLAIAVERYIYVVYALRYYELMNTRRVLYMISTVWIAAILGTLPLYFWNYWKDEDGICDDFNIAPVEYVIIFGVSRVIVIMILVTIFHWRIHHAALKIQNRTEPTVALNTRSARLVLIICFIYFISWMPSSVSYLCKKYGVDVPKLLYEFSVSIIDINYVANPFIYAYNNRGIGDAISRTLMFCRQKYTSRCCSLSLNLRRQESKSSGACDSQQTTITGISSTVVPLETNVVSYSTM